MILRSRFHTLLSLAAVAVTAAFVSLNLTPISASAPPRTQVTSYLVLNSQKDRVGSDASPCSSAGCANGIRFTWTAGECYQGDRYPPLELVWSSKNRVSTKAWALTAPCSTGIQLSWDKYNQINSAKWLGASSRETSEGLAVCFQYQNQCNAGHCVTAGCIPQHTTGFDLFFQDGDTPTASQWLVTGKSAGSAAISGSPSNVFWYGYTPPTNSFNGTPSATTTYGVPSVTLTGRDGSDKPQIVSNTALGGAGGVDMSWFLPNYESGVYRGCHLSGY